MAKRRRKKSIKKQSQTKLKVSHSNLIKLRARYRKLDIIRDSFIRRSKDKDLTDDQRLDVESDIDHLTKLLGFYEELLKRVEEENQ